MEEGFIIFYSYEGRGMWHIQEGNVHRILVGKPHGRTPLARPRRTW
jgi:hypothetical protein